ncbi:class F sortase [Streptomyces sp. NPDC003635]
MGRPLSRRGLVAGLCLALIGCAVAAALAVASWPDRDAVGSDFGRVPAAAATTGARSEAPATERAATGGTGGDASGSATSGNDAAATQPSRLSLPRLGISAPVDPVGVAADGQVEIPKDPQRVGWYRFSPAPGAPKGSTVVVGHVDSDGQGLGVLVALNEVRRGDQVLVQRADGARVTYQITARRTVAKDALSASGAFRRDGPAVLTLITCAGPYLSDQGGYQNNLVVTAVERPR